MKKRALCALILALMCIGGCGTKDVKAEVAELYGAGHITATADFTVYGETSLDYTVAYEKNGETARVTLLAPACVAGIAASIDESGTKLTYDGLAVDTLLPAISGFQPVDALEWVVRDLRGAVADEVLLKGRGEDRRVVLTYVQEADGVQLEKHITLAGEGLVLSGAEFLVDGECVMRATIREMSIAQGDKN